MVRLTLPQWFGYPTLSGVYFAADPVYSRFMMKNETAYTSPHSGLTYDVVAEAKSRVDYREFMNAETRYVREYTQYNFYREGKLVTFTFDLDEKRLAATFGEIEGYYAGWGLSPRD